MGVQNYSDFERTFGGKVRHLRKARKFTQENLAEYVGVSVITISRIEHGKTMPSISRLFQIAQALEVNVTDFFETELLELKVTLEDVHEHSQTINDLVEAILKKLK